MRITIKSNGTSGGTELLDEEGNKLPYDVTAVRFQHEARGIPEAEIELMMVKVEAFNAPTKVYGTNGKEIRRIEYVDGSSDDFTDGASSPREDLADPRTDHHTGYVSSPDYPAMVFDSQGRVITAVDQDWLYDGQLIEDDE